MLATPEAPARVPQPLRAARAGSRRALRRGGGAPPGENRTRDASEAHSRSRHSSMSSIDSTLTRRPLASSAHSASSPGSSTSPGASKETSYPGSRQSLPCGAKPRASSLSTSPPPRAVAQSGRRAPQPREAAREGRPAREDRASQEVRRGEPLPLRSSRVCRTRDAAPAGRDSTAGRHASGRATRSSPR